MILQSKEIGSMQNPQVIVSHPGKQHSYQTAYALQKEGMLLRYFTSIWYVPDELPYVLLNYLPLKLKRKIHDILVKRSFEYVNNSLVNQVALYEILGRIGEIIFKAHYTNWYIANKMFDKQVSRRIKHLDFDIFIGYETASLNCFKRSAELHKTCILDFAAIHPFFQRKILNRLGINPYGGFKNLWEKIEKRKLEELDLADYILTPSEFAKNTLLEAGISESKILKLPYGCNIELFNQKEKYNKSRKLKILYVGAITTRKGMKYLLETIKELNISDIEFIMVGSVTDSDLILKHFDGFYRHVPFQNNKDLLKYYQDADIFVFPSLMDSFAMVVLEAMACGTPVIVSENTGAKDIVREGVDGFTIPVMDVEKLKEKILYFYNNRDSIEEMGRSARKQADKYTWENYQKKLADIVANCLNK